MGAAEQIPRISFEDFLRLEEVNASKHYMMAGGTFEHGRLVDNLLVTLRQRLQGRPCQPYSGTSSYARRAGSARIPM